METIHLDLNKRYSFADHLTWMDQKRRELFNGFVKLMSTVPSLIHQEILFQLVTIFGKHLKGKTCKAYRAPFDVRLPENGENSDSKIFTVVQPDFCIVCDLNKLDEKGCLGAPDFIAEIVSKNNPERDVDEKFRIYEKHGVREYWIIFPNDKTINVFLLNNDNKYGLVGMFSGKTKVKVNVLDDVDIELAEVFVD